MEDQNKCVMPDLESEYHRQLEVNQKMSNEIKDMQTDFGNMERNNAIMKAQLDIVYLIFGGRNHG